MENKVPLVSVLIPTYNRADTISESIDSVLAQTSKDFEIIIIDDGSIDNTREVLEAYENKIDYYYKDNGGESSARNFGVKKARGKYIAFLDSDDIWCLERLQKLIGFMEKNDSFGAIISEIEFIDINGKKLFCSSFKNDFPRDGHVLSYMLKNLVGMFSNMIVRKDVVAYIGEFDENLKTAADIDYFLRIAAEYKIALFPESLLKYRKVANSLSHSLFTQNRLRVIAKFKKIYPVLAKENNDILKKTISVVHLRYAEDLLLYRYINDSRNQARKSLFNNFSLKATFLYLKSFLIEVISYVDKSYKDRGKVEISIKPGEPLISVIIPTYNRADLICQAIDSVINQSYKNVEIIVSDDGSTDNTQEILNGYKNKIRYLYYEHVGCSNARNKAIKESKGEYVAFLDSDDRWYPEKLKKQIDLLSSNPELGMVISEVEILNANNKKISFSDIKKTVKKEELGVKEVLKMLLEKKSTTCSYMLTKKKILEDVGLFSESLTTAEDVDIMLKVSMNYKIGLIVQPLVKYKKSANSLSNQLVTKNRLKVIDNFSRDNPEFVARNKKFISKITARINIDYAQDLLWYRHIKESQYLILESMRCHFTIQAIVLFLKSLVLNINFPLSLEKGNKLIDRKINLLFLNYSFDIGGIETLILAMCRSLDKSRFNISVCSFKEKNFLKNEFEQLGIAFYQEKKQEGIDLKLIIKLSKLFKDQNIDIVHSHNAAQWFYAVLACIGLKKTKIIHTQHSTLRPEEFKLIYFLRYLAIRTTAVVCVVKNVAEYLLVKAKVNAKKIKVVYNGIDTKKYSNEAALKPDKTVFGIPSVCRVIGNIARLAPVKDHKTLMDGFKIAFSQLPDIRLLLIGNGPMMEELKQYARQLNIEKEVIFLGDRRDIPELLRILDIFILSSLSEGLSITLLEAMSAALPIIATEVGGNPEVIANSKTGLLIPSRSPDKLAQAIIWMLQNHQESITMGRRALQVVIEQFSIEKMTSEYEKLYCQIAA
ncbi:MAG: glycosyltransferase [Candidatus Omnitrophota bacterium]|jgi:glycosyltransferase involved in cell wall biosynthesis